ncbi:MAG: CpaF family protein [Actinomycetes bacterium]
MTPEVPPEVRERVRQQFVAGRAGASDPQPPAQALAELLLVEAPLLSQAVVEQTARAMAVELVGLGPVEDLLADPLVTDVLVNGPGPVWVERAGRLEQTGVVLDGATIHRYVERLVGPLGLQADRAHPVVDARLPDGTRVAVVLPPLAVDGPVLAVRRHGARPLPLGAFCDDLVGQLLTEQVRAGANLLLYGPTGSGKTTLLNALVAGLPKEERIVTVEDVAELRLPGDHVVRLEARPGSADGAGAVGVRQLVHAALRLRPDRLVVGEVRGAEALDMVWALSTGHRGSLSTCHAGSPAEALARLETMCCAAPEQLPLAAVRAQVRSAVDVLVGLGRDHAGSRRVVAVHQVAAQGDPVDLLGSPCASA